MPFKQVTEQDLKGKGVIGQPAVPGLSVTEMQKSVEQVVREAAIPAHNRLCEELEAEAAAADIGAVVPGDGDIPPETPKKLQSVLEAMLAWAKERLGLKADKADTYTKQETDEKISEGITDTGFKEAVQQAKQSAEDAKGYAESIDPAQFAQEAEGVPTVNASKEQNVFDIELPSSNQFVMVPDSAYALGDTFKISGRAVAARMPNGETLPDGFFEAGAKVLCLWEDDLLYFNGGGSAPKNIMRYRLDDGTPAQPPAPINADTTPVIWGQTSDGKDAYVKTCTAGVYNPATGKTIDEEMATCMPDGGENLPPTPIDADTLQGYAADYFVSQETLDAQRTYSTEEQWTGEYWVDGKKIYRKYIEVTLDAATKTVPHLIDNIGDFKRFDLSKSCIEISPNGNPSPVVVPMYVRGTYYTAVEYTSGDKIAIYLGSELLNYKPVTAKLILIYTKNET